MDAVLNQISRIEEAASAIMEEAGARKREFAARMEEKTREFDRRIEEETRRRIKRVREDMEREMAEKLERQKADSDALLEEISKNYESCHEEYVERMFQEMIRE